MKKLIYETKISQYEMKFKESFQKTKFNKEQI